MVKLQIDPQSKQLLIDEIMDIRVKIMGRNRDLTVITVDEPDEMTDSCN